MLLEQKGDPLVGKMKWPCYGMIKPMALAALLIRAISRSVDKSDLAAHCTRRTYNISQCLRWSVIVPYPAYANSSC